MLVTAVIDIAVGGFFLSLIHILVPHHWLPFITLSQGEGWSIQRTLGATALAGVSHSASTIVIGLLVGLFGYQLSRQTELVMLFIAPLLLFAIGAFLVARNLWRPEHPHRHHFAQMADQATIFSLVLIMFFSPCLEIEPYYFVAAREGWLGLFTLSAIYLTVNVMGMLVLVLLGTKGTKHLKFPFIDRRYRLLNGLAFMGLAAISFFVQQSALRLW